MIEHEILMELEDICFKYDRLESLIGILQMYTAEVVEVAGEPNDRLSNALYEIEMEMVKNNERLKKILCQKGGAA